MRTRIWHSDWKPRWLIRCVSAALLSFMDNQETEYPGGGAVYVACASPEVLLRPTDDDSAGVLGTMQHHATRTDGAIQGRLPSLIFASQI